MTDPIKKALTKALRDRIRAQIAKLGDIRAVPSQRSLSTFERIEKANQATAEKAYRNFLKVEGLPTFDPERYGNWYRMPEVLDALGGPDSPSARQFGELLGFTSANNPVAPNIGQSVLLHPSMVAARRGEGPLSAAVLREQGYNPFLPSGTGGLGSMAHRTGAGLMANALEGVGLSSQQQPKMWSYGVRNLLGDESVGTIDSHINRTAQWIFPSSGVKLGPPDPLDYRGPEAALTVRAEELGLTPAQYQASLWFGNADATEVAKQSRGDVPRDLIPQFWSAFARATGNSEDAFLRKWLAGDPELWVGAGESAPAWMGRFRRPSVQRDLGL